VATSFLNDHNGKTSWLRAMATIWVLLSGALIAVAQLRNIDLLTNVTAMLQLGFGSLIAAYVAPKFSKNNPTNVPKQP
jgi:hypothetical protein